MGVEICDFRAVLHFCNIVTKTQVLVRRRIRIHDQCQQLAFPLFVELQQIASLFIVTIVIFKFLVLKYVTCELLLFWRKANPWHQLTNLTFCKVTITVMDRKFLKLCDNIPIFVSGELPEITICLLRLRMQNEMLLLILVII